MQTKRTNIEIDQDLMRDALKETGLKTQKAIVHEGVRLLLKRTRQQAILKSRGKRKWDGDLAAMRTDK